MRGVSIGVCCFCACTGSIVIPERPPSPPPDSVCPANPSIGRTALHRLSNSEYDNSVEALLNDMSGPSQAFPPDVTASGFDHITDVQSVSPLHGVRYEEAAQTLAHSLWGREFDTGFTHRFEAEQNEPDGGVDAVHALVVSDLVSNGARTFYNGYHIYVLTAFDVAGDYEVGFEAWSNTFPDGGEPLSDGGFRQTLWRLQLDNQVFFSTPTMGTVASHATHRAALHVEVPGIHRIDLSAADPHDRDNCGPDGGPADCEARDPELGQVDALWVSRQATRVPEGQQRLRICELTEGDTCVRSTLALLTRRAFRRPPASDELDRLMALFAAARTDGDSLEEAFGQAVAAILLSPHFLFLVQTDPAPSGSVAHPLTSHELAARLSFFLTQGPPDDALAARADDGSLLETSVLAAETDRLLASATHPRMLTNLSTQFMGTRDLVAAKPSAQLFPNFSPELKTAMATEAQLLFEFIFSQPRPMVELADAPYTFLNDRLAAHYQLPLPGSDQPVKVSLPNDERGGLLGLGSTLTITSTPTRPSQVKRGVWILGRLLCDEPPPPPPNVPPLVEDQSGADGLTAHTANPACTRCHKVIDPIGLALDHYDADGSRRIADRQGKPVSAKGTMPDGTEVVDLAGIRTLVKQDKRFEACLSEHLFTYALARTPAGDDPCIAAALAASTGEKGKATFHDVVRALVQSEAFRWRQPE
ncbi:MAG: DUF1592 domain-containing protein [Myxococcaceae bacterium]|nr:DUF1592 domain-containing protein [Myxococcaceae bacterium]